MIEATLPGIKQENPLKGSAMWPLPRLLGRLALPLVRHKKGRLTLLGNRMSFKIGRHTVD